jgi:hypothetical protein
MKVAPRYVVASESKITLCVESGARVGALANPRFSPALSARRASNARIASRIKRLSGESFFVRATLGGSELTRAARFFYYRGV